MIIKFLKNRSNKIFMQRIIENRKFKSSAIISNTFNFSFFSFADEKIVMKKIKNRLIMPLNIFKLV